MLSRAAERIYWAGRYLERAENTARIVQQHTQLLLDIPAEAGVGWQELMAIFGVRERIRESDEERVVLEFLVSDPGGVSSLISSIRSARDNIRNSRDLLPQESWESANELYQLSRRRLERATDAEDRFDLLSDCIGRCQQINGILSGTMSHTSPFHFLTLGQTIERADMTSRIIDVAAAYLQQNEALVLRYGSTLWTNVLKSVSGFQMYRQYQQPQVVGIAAIDFLLNDVAFPRAVRACIESAKRTAGLLPRSDGLIGVLEKAEQDLPYPLPEHLDGAGVSDQMDTLQKHMGSAHAAVVETWFLPGE